MTSTAMQASKLISWGYRGISNRHRLIARIDRPDWYRVMARKHAPWDPNGEGMDWVFGLGAAAAGDFYRRVYSRDRKTVDDKVFKMIPNSNHDACGYCRKHGEPQRYEACRGDIEVGTKIIDEFVNPSELVGMYKVHSISVLQGKSGGNHTSFHPDFKSARNRAESIVQRDPGAQIALLKVTHLVRTSGPPIEVIDLEDLEC